MRSVTNCGYYLRGACTRNELQNPGYDEACRCARLVALAAAWDDFLDRAEAFGLNEQDAARIWNSRRHSALSAPGMCPVPSVTARPPARTRLPDCPYLFNTACLLAMPECQGLCDMYRARE